MKRILLSLLLVGVVLALSSCNIMLGWILADKMTLDGEDEYELAEMYLDYYGNPNGPHQFSLLLVSEGVNYGEYDITGNGDLIIVDLASPDRNLADGTYEYTSSSTYDDFDMVWGLVVIGADFGGTDPPNELYLVVGGTVEVKMLFNDDYLIKMELELEDEYGASSDLELYFQGELADEYDLSSSYSIAAPLGNWGPTDL